MRYTRGLKYRSLLEKFYRSSRVIGIASYRPFPAKERSRENVIKRKPTWLLKNLQSSELGVSEWHVENCERTLRARSSQAEKRSEECVINEVECAHEIQHRKTLGPNAFSTYIPLIALIEEEEEYDSRVISR